jgi:hypothetical protein
MNIEDLGFEERIGLLSNVWKVGSTKKNDLKQAKELTTKGRGQPGYGATMRMNFYNALQDITQKPFQEMYFDANDALPYFSTQYLGQEVHTAHPELVHKDDWMLLQTYVHSQRSRMQEICRNAATVLQHELQRTNAYKDGNMEDQLYLLLDAEMVMSETVQRTVAQWQKFDARKSLAAALPLYHSNELIASTLSTPMRRLVQEHDGVGNALTKMRNKKIRSEYADPKMKDGLEQMPKFLQMLIHTSVDAFSHKNLGRFIADAKPGRWQHGKEIDQSMPSLQYVYKRPESDYVYTRQKFGDFESDGLTVDRSKHGQDIFGVSSVNIEDSIPTFGSTGRQELHVMNLTQYNGLSYDLLPKEAPETLHSILSGTRKEIARVLEYQQALIASLPNFKALRLASDGSDYAIAYCEKENQTVLHGVVRNEIPDVSAEPGLVVFATTKNAPHISDDESDAPSEPVTALDEKKTCRTILRSTKRPHMKWSAVRRLLLRIGMEEIINEGKGSHIKFQNPLNEDFCILSGHYTSSATTDVPIGIVIACLEDMGLNDAQIALLDQEVERL